MRFLMFVAVVMILVGLTMHLRGPRRAETVAVPPAAIVMEPAAAPAARASQGDKNPPGG